MKVIPLEEEYLGYPVGWAVVLRENKILKDLQLRNSKDLSQEEAQRYATRLNKLFKGALQKIEAYEYVDLRMHLEDPYQSIIARVGKQLAGVLLGFMTTRVSDDLATQSTTFFAAMAVLQNYLNLTFDYVHYSDEKTSGGTILTGRHISEFWRKEIFPEQFKQSNLGPGMIQNTIVRTLPLSDMLEPAYRSLTTIPQSKQDIFALK